MSALSVTQTLSQTRFKRCTKCFCTKPATREFFHARKSAKDGLTQPCKVCHALRGKRYAQENRERVAKYKKRYAQENRKKIVEYKARHYQENREKINAANKRHREENPEWHRDYDRRYYEENKEHIKARAREYFWENRERYREAAREYYLRNQEEIRQKAREYYEQNKERILPYAKEYREANQEQIARYQSEYREKNAERFREYRQENREERAERFKRWYEENREAVRAYRKANRERYNAHARNRYALVKEAEGTHTFEEVFQMQEDQDHLCAYCEGPLFGELHVDHMIPISQGGRNDWTNLAVTCPACNLHKNARTAEEFMECLRQEGRVPA